MDLEKELEEVREALKKANEEAKTFRLERNDLRQQLDEADKYKGFYDKYLAAEAKLALSADGVTNPERFVKLMDLSSLDINEDGEVEGLDEAIETIKESLPEVFDKRTRAGGANIDPGDKTPPVNTLSASEKQAAMLLGK